MKICLFFISFLIFSSCDLPNEAESDCSGIHLGSAFIDDCGYCVGGNTGLDENFADVGCGCDDLAPAIYCDDTDGDGIPDYLDPNN